MWIEEDSKLLKQVPFLAVNLIDSTFSSLRSGEDSRVGNCRTSEGK
jgi:hypothetical protein